MDKDRIAGAAKKVKGSIEETIGTPDEPKRCPPMPRRALQTYPANRVSSLEDGLSAARYNNGGPNGLERFQVCAVDRVAMFDSQR
jgi:hypothetical protein